MSAAEIVMIGAGYVGLAGLALSVVVVLAVAANEIRMRVRGWRRERVMREQHADPLLAAAHEATAVGRVLLFNERTTGARGWS